MFHNPLIKTVKEYNEVNVQLILEMGADPNFKDPFQRTALHHAV